MSDIISIMHWGSDYIEAFLYQLVVHRLEVGNYTVIYYFNGNLIWWHCVSSSWLRFRLICNHFCIIMLASTMGWLSWLWCWGGWWRSWVRESLTSCPLWGRYRLAGFALWLTVAEFLHHQCLRTSDQLHRWWKQGGTRARAPPPFQRYAYQ